jgi:putative acetyltransferase
MIRKHTPADLESILSIWYEASTLAHPFLASDFVEQVKHDMRHLYVPGSDTSVFVEDGDVVGFVSMMNNEIGGLFVRPTHHSKGIGTQLVQHVGKLHPLLEVEVFEKNSIGRAFYTKYGFQEEKAFFHEASNQRVLRLSYQVI